jgi:hypothetical protein
MPGYIIVKPPYVCSRPLAARTRSPDCVLLRTAENNLTGRRESFDTWRECTIGVWTQSERTTRGPRLLPAACLPPKAREHKLNFSRAWIRRWRRPPLPNARSICSSSWPSSSAAARAPAMTGGDREELGITTGRGRAIRVGDVRTGTCAIVAR